MEHTIEPLEYKPTETNNAKTMPVSSEQLQSTLESLVASSRDLKRFPYDPERWLARGRILRRLGYPELALGDAWKSEYCCRKLLGRRTKFRGWHLGANRGFWMFDLSYRRRSWVQIQVKLRAIKQAAIDLQNDLTDAGLDQRFSIVAQQYPWLGQRHRVRSDELLAIVNEELSSKLVSSSMTCSIERDAYILSERASAKADDEAWGVFANKAIPGGTIFLKDSCELMGRSNDRHCNIRMANDGLDWLQQCSSGEVSKSLLKIKCLLQCVQDRSDHPLDHPVLARLRPTYHTNEPVNYSLDLEIKVTNLALLQAGIDIFANHSFDTWILFTVEARLDNNLWSRPNSCCLSPIFAMFNHSCDPNIAWNTASNAMTLTTTRDVQAGEQLFVSYSSYAATSSVQERRRLLRRWIDGDCACTKCIEDARVVKVHADGWADTEVMVSGQVVW